MLTPGSAQFVFFLSFTITVHPVWCEDEVLEIRENTGETTKEEVGERATIEERGTIQDV